MSRSLPSTGLDVPRVLGVRDNGRPGPLVIVVAGQHGNEPGGVAAAKALLDLLPVGRGDVRGRLVVFSGNRAALRLGVRHQGRDLNRLWHDEVLAELAERPAEADVADLAELRELHDALARELASAGAREVTLIDLHTTSAGGAGFTVIPDSIPSRLLARSLPLPVILGLEERLEGPLLTWMARQGFTAIVLEGGQHEDPTSARACLAGLWVALAHTGLVDARHPEVSPSRAMLARVSHGLPPVMDLSYVHSIEAGDTYVMEPGWRNFMRVRRDQSLALQNGDLVQAPLDGYMLMPLYQGLGGEGYFLCRPVSPTWLTISRWMRMSRLEWLLRIAPGVRRLEAREGRCHTRRRLPRMSVGLLHLFGFRKRELVGDDAAVWLQKPQRRG